MKVRRRIFWLGVAVLIPLALVLSMTPALVELEGKGYDLRLRTLGPGHPVDSVWLVGIDDESIEDLSLRLPWPRSVHAALVRQLQSRSVKAVFLDLLFEEDREDPEEDLELRDALLDAGNVILGGAAAPARGADTPGAPPLMPRLKPPRVRAAAPQGLVNYRPDPDDVVRWALMGLEATTLAPGAQTRYYPTAAVLLLARLEGIGPEAILPEKHKLRVGTRRIPITVASGVPGRPNDMLIRYFARATGPGARPDPPRTLRYVSYSRLLHDDDPILEEIAGASAVIVGENTRSDVDVVGTPVGRMKGFEAHAQILCQLLRGDFLNALSPTANGVLLAGLCLLLGLQLERARTQTRALALWLVTAAVYVVLNGLLFWSGWYAQLVAPLVGTGFTFSWALLLRYLATVEIFTQFVAGDVVGGMIASDRAAEVGVKDVTATVMLTDIRGYTALSESRRPLDIMNMLNEYHGLTTDIYTRNGGTVVTYQGDAQIVVFGAPRRIARPAEAAVTAALEAEKGVAELRQRWGIEKREQFDVGAGICTGRLAIGVLGSKTQRQYTAVGETIRKAHKVQSLSTQLDSPILIDEATYAACEDRVEADEKPPTTVEGLDYALKLYKPISLKPKPGRRRRGKGNT